MDSQLYNEIFWNSVKAIKTRYVSIDDAKDAVQEAIIEISKSIDTCMTEEAVKELAKKFLNHNRCVSDMTKDAEKKFATLFDDFTAREARTARIISSLIDLMPNPYRKALRLVYLQNIDQ